MLYQLSYVRVQVILATVTRAFAPRRHLGYDRQERRARTADKESRNRGVPGSAKES